MPLLRIIGAGIAGVLLMTVLARAAVDPKPAAAAEKQDEDQAWLPGDPQYAAKPFNARGEVVYQQTCAVCHDARVPRAPDPYILRTMPPSAIYRALTTGAMRTQAQSLTDEDRRAVAEYLAGRALSAASQLEPPKCSADAARFDYEETPINSEWGMDAFNTRHVPSAEA